ncbi:MAG: hydantoinase/oxoprolinase family protein, partial [Actinomycetota bacterium]|nr:hydantoinase/oxoprolinase family protein [Actinomycetota bacterium]
DAAARAVGQLGAELGLDELEAASGIVRLANAEMVRALRVVTVNRGIDPREFALLPFGGAGPMHAAELAAEMGMSRLICPRAGGVLSALGLLASARRRDTAKTVMIEPGGLTQAAVAAAVGELRENLADGMDVHTETISYELRYQGQAFGLPVEAGPDASPAELTRRFAEAHERHYGFEVPDAPVELVAIRLALAGKPPELEPRAAEGEVEDSSRRVRFGGEWHEASVATGEPAAGAAFTGPAVLELPESTLVLPPGWRAEVDGHGSVLAALEEGP